MRIKTTDENGGYKVLDIDEIESGALDISKKIETLEEYGDCIRQQVNIAKHDFDTANYDRVYETIDRYRGRLSSFQDEMSELLNSVKEYQEDKHRRWD